VSDAEALAVAIEALMDRMIERKLATRTAPASGPAPAPARLLSYRAAAEIVGVRSTKTISRYVEAGLPSYGSGNGKRVREDELRRFLEARATGAAAEEDHPAGDRGRSIAAGVLKLARR
jgi:hypothetical protein